MMAGPYRAFSARQGDGGSLRVLRGGRMNAGSESMGMQ
jgi:hypothetical protein